jgi:hypothetical protein
LIDVHDLTVWMLWIAINPERRQERSLCAHTLCVL